MYRFLIISILLIVGCKQIYDPDIENNISALVIQGLMTNEGEITVKITKAVSYDTIDNRISIKDAQVSVIDDLGTIYNLTQDGSGSYITSGIHNWEGRLYRLKVITADGNVYESSPQSMPRTYDQDSIYASSITRDILVPSVSGGYISSQESGIETYVDLNSGDVELPKCRYDIRVTVLYTDTMGTPPVTIFYWKTFNPNKDLNVTSSKFDKSTGMISKHPLCFYKPKISVYDEKPDLVLAGFIMAVKKYNLSRDAHQYYINIINQQQAAGKIFDPTPSQILGNIQCTSNPDKLVFGFFEVSNVENLYYRYVNTPRGLLLVAKDGFPELTDEGEKIGIPPLFWSY